MASDPKINNKLMDLLTSMDFSNKYYQLYELVKSLPSSDEPPDLTPDQIVHSVFDTANHLETEDFYQIIHSFKSFDILLHLAVNNNRVEYGLYLMKEGKFIAGGTFHKLSRELKRLDDPGFEHFPRYPRLPYYNGQSLENILQFGKNLFQDIIESIDQDHSFKV